jgi:hypothetical protein
MVLGALAGLRPYPEDPDMTRVRPVSPSCPERGSSVHPVPRVTDAWRRDIARYVAYRQRRFRCALRRALRRRRGRP